MRKKKLPWEAMKGVTLADLIVKGRLWWGQYDKMRQEEMEVSLADEIKPFKKLSTFAPIDKETEDMSVMCTKRRKILGVQGLAEGMGDVMPEGYSETTWTLRYWDRGSSTPPG